jgi:hypothetical protein
MMCVWLEKWVEFQYQGITVRLHGMVPSQPQELLEISMEQVLKLEKENDLVAVLLEPESKSTTPEPKSMVFHPRSKTSFISMVKFSRNQLLCLLKDSMIIPFPYCPMLPQSIADLIDTSQKNEIERQVAAMLKASTIVRGQPLFLPYFTCQEKGQFMEILY